jgi:hypothetical protein
VAFWSNDSKGLAAGFVTGKLAPLAGCSPFYPQIIVSDNLKASIIKLP